MKKKLFLLLPILFFLACQQQEETITNNPTKKLQTILDSLREVNAVPGINLSMLFEDGKQINLSSGYADTAKKELLTPGHVMLSGSIGKTYAVALLMQMVDEQKLVLDNKIKDYFPELAWLDSLPNINEITVRMLLQHTSGLPRYVFYNQMQVWDSLAQNPDKVWSGYDRLSVVFGAEAVHEVGKKWGYSDTNYILLGMLIEKLMNKEYYALLQERILTPLKLQTTYAANKRILPNLSNGYLKEAEMFHMPHVMVNNGIYAINPQMEWTGGGIASTTSDLALWCKYYYHGNIFSDSLKAQIIKINPYGREVLGLKGLHYGMGSFIYDTKYGKAYGHTGTMPGYKSIFAWFPEKKMAIALQANCDYAQEKMSYVKYIEEILTVLE